MDFISSSGFHHIDRVCSVANQADRANPFQHKTEFNRIAMAAESPQKAWSLTKAISSIIPLY
jgi:hypothetical protein